MTGNLAGPRRVAFGRLWRPGSKGYIWLARQMSMGVSLDAGAIAFADPEADQDVSLVDRISGGLTPQVRPFVRWRWDTQDNPLNPTRGFALAASAGYILEIDRETVANERKTVLNDFIKWEASAEGAHETRLGPVLAGMIHYGGSLGEGTSLLPPNERFTLGGTTGMRGFADHAVGRYASDGTLALDLVDIEQLGGGNVVLNGSLEVRFPLIRQAGVWMGAFVDAGVLGRTHSDLHPKAVRASSGVGLRYLIGNQIPVRLDWGFILGETRCLQWRADAPGGTCEMREEDSAFHFDLLYPF